MDGSPYNGVSLNASDVAEYAQRHRDGFAVPTSKTVIESLHRLEVSGCAYSLSLHGFPVWWFIRNHVHDSLVRQLTGDGADAVQSRSPLTIPLTRIRRVVAGLLRARACWRQNPVLFFVGSNSSPRRAPADHKLVGDVYSLLPQAKRVFVQKPTDEASDRVSLQGGRDIVFFDWALAAATLRLFELGGSRLQGVAQFVESLRAIDGLPIDAGILQRTVLEKATSLQTKISVQMQAARLLLERTKPSVIVETASYDSAAVALNLLAKQQGIPIVEVQHGVIYRDHPGYSVYPPAGQQIATPVPDRILVYGEWFRDELLAASPVYHAAGLRVAGSPTLSKFRRQLSTGGSTEIRRKIRNQLGIPSEAYLVTVTTQPIINRQLVAFLSKVGLSLPYDWYICVKLHPGETSLFNTLYHGLRSHPQFRVVKDGAYALYDLLVGSDVHASVSSTVVLEAMALGIPNIVISMDTPFEVTNIMETSEGQVVTSPEAFIRSCMALTSDKGLRSAIVNRGVLEAARFFDDSYDFASVALSAIGELGPAVQAGKEREAEGVRED